MKKLYFLILFLLTPSFFFAQSYNVDVSNTNIEWLGEKTSGSHNGIIMIKNGFIQTNNSGLITEGEFVLDMESITCTDLQGSKKGYLEEIRITPLPFHFILQKALSILLTYVQFFKSLIH